MQKNKTDNEINSLKFEIIEQKEQIALRNDKLDKANNDISTYNKVRLDYESGTKKLFDKISELDKEYILFKESHNAELQTYKLKLNQAMDEI